MKKIEYQVDTKKGQTVYDIQINVRETGDAKTMSSMYPNGIHVKVLKIVHQTPYKIALSDDFITLLDRIKKGSKKESYQHCLDEIRVTIRAKDTFWPNGVFGHVYTTKDPEKEIKLIKHKMINQVNKDYGFLRTADIEQTIYDMEINYKP